MMRHVVVVVHLVLATFFAISGSVLLVQSALNLRWEQGFYGQPSPLSLAVAFSCVVLLGIALVQVLSSAAYAARLRIGAWGLLACSLLLVLTLPGPASWILAAAAGVVLVDLLPRPAPTE